MESLGNLEWIGLVLVCWITADFLAGLFHWWEDEYIEETWPILGSLVGAPNQQHHADPLAFTKPCYVERNWTTILPAAILFWILYPSPWCLVAVFVSQANEIHAWSHQKCNWFIAMVQETGILQHPRSHAKHHRFPYSRRYCVMSDWLNPVLDAFDFWRRLEWIVFWTVGASSRSLVRSLKPSP